jgi:hypothetical protein
MSPDEWLPIIFAGRVPAAIEGTPEHLAVNTIFNRYNEVSITLADNPQAYRPMFMNHEGGVIVSDWAAGFMLSGSVPMRGRRSCSPTCAKYSRRSSCLMI